MKLKNAEIAKNPGELSLGLMFRRDVKGALVLDLGRMTRRGAAIHTFCMRFAIDLFFVDDKYKVVDIKRNARPWKILFVPKKACRFVVEAKAGKVKVRVGDKLEW